MTKSRLKENIMKMTYDQIEEIRDGCEGVTVLATQICNTYSKEGDDG